MSNQEGCIFASQLSHHPSHRRDWLMIGYAIFNDRSIRRWGRLVVLSGGGGLMKQCRKAAQGGPTCRLEVRQTCRDSSRRYWTSLLPSSRADVLIHQRLDPESAPQTSFHKVQCIVGLALPVGSGSSKSSHSQRPRTMRSKVRSSRSFHVIDKTRSPSIHTSNV